MPVRLDQLEGTRKTYGECYLSYELFENDVSHEVQTEEISRRNGENQEPVHFAWTGQTRFALKEYVQPESVPPKKKARTQENGEGGVNMDVDEEEERKAPENC